MENVVFVAEGQIRARQPTEQGRGVQSPPVLAATCEDFANGTNNH